jgi:hypothetical protein
VLKDAQERTYVLDASFGDDGQVYVTDLDAAKDRPGRVRLDTSGISAISPFSSAIIRDRLLLYMNSSDGERASIDELIYRLPSFERESVTRVIQTERIVFYKSIPLVPNGVAILYKSQRGGVFGLDLAVKDETGWSMRSIPGVEGLDVARTAEYAAEGGQLLVVLSAEDKGRAKQRVYGAWSPDRGETWRLQRIDTPEGTSTRAWLPDVATAGNRAVSVWEDSRGIRAAVRMQLSEDLGRSWLARDIQVSDGRHHAIRPRIGVDEGSLYVGWYQYRTDARREADAKLIRLSWEDAVGTAMQTEAPASSEEKDVMLRRSVADYWDSMIKGDVQRAYQLQDPFFRARVSFDAYAAQRGPFVYHSHVTRNVTIDGNVAHVQSTTNFEIPRLLVLGREQSVPPRDFEIDDTWLYVDGHWYREYIDPLSGGSAINY